MEIKINKEIRNYKETLFFGLSLRQFICSLLAVGVAVALYSALPCQRKAASSVAVPHFQCWLGGAKE